MRFEIKKAAELLYPRRCALCDRLLRGNEKGVCRACGKTVRPLPSGTGFMPNGFAAFPYTGAVRMSVHRLKYGGRAEYADFFAAALLAAGGSLLRAWNIQALVPVPVHASRLRRRGYNQAERIARALEKRTGIPVLENCVERVRSTRPQSGLTPEERRRNVKNAFRSCGKEPLPASVLIVDDIYTTGSTVGSLTKTLKKAGAAEVYFCAACLADGHSGAFISG